MFEDFEYKIGVALLKPDENDNKIICLCGERGEYRRYHKNGIKRF